MKIGGKAHAALAQFASQHPGETFTAPQIKKAVAAAGFEGAIGGVIPGDHAVKPDGSPADLGGGVQLRQEPRDSVVRPDGA
jgi:hypothetical protein